MAKENNEPTQIYCTAGPYAGQRLTVSPAEAKQAIADGWAVDPDAPPPAADEAPKDVTPEQRAKTLEAAEKAANKLRGEPETRDMTPDEGGHYKTRGKRGE
jgi:hypothetical protein